MQHSSLAQSAAVGHRLVHCRVGFVTAGNHAEREGGVADSQRGRARRSSDEANASP